MESHDKNPSIWANSTLSMLVALLALPHLWRLVLIGDPGPTATLLAKPPGAAVDRVMDLSGKKRVLGKARGSRSTQKSLMDMFLR